MGSVLLALLSAWGLAFRHDARTRRRDDPIGDIFETWLERPERGRHDPARPARTPGRPCPGLPSETPSPKETLR